MGLENIEITNGFSVTNGITNDKRFITTEKFQENIKKINEEIKKINTNIFNIDNPSINISISNELINYYDASLNNVDIFGDLIVQGNIIFKNGNQVDLTNITIDLNSYQDASLGNVDISGDLNVNSININTDYKIDLSGGNFVILQSLQDGNDNVIFKHDKNSNQVIMAGFQGGLNPEEYYDKTYIDNSLNTKADKEYVNISFQAFDASFSDVYNTLNTLDTSINSKANISDIPNDFYTTSYIDSSFSNVKTRLDTIDTSIDSKANISDIPNDFYTTSYIDNSFSNVKTRLDTLDTSIDSKANISDIPNDFYTTSYIDSSFSNVKTRLDTIDTSIDSKANISDIPNDFYTTSYIDSSFSNVKTRLDTIDTSIDSKANISDIPNDFYTTSYIDSSFSNVKTRLDTIDTSISSKANISDIPNDFYTTSYIDSSFSNVKTRLDTIDTSISSKANISDIPNDFYTTSYIDSSFSNVKTRLDTLDTSINSKANISDIPNDFYTTSYIDSSFSNVKTRLDTLDTSIDSKANKLYVDSSLNFKADKSYVDNSLQLKANMDDITDNYYNKSYVDNSLNEKIGYGQDIDLIGYKCLFANMYQNEIDLPNASTYHGMFAHVHTTGAAYFAHNNEWVKLANESQLSEIVNDIAGNASDIDSMLENIIGENNFGLTGKLWEHIYNESNWTGRLSGHNEVTSLHTRLEQLEDKNLDTRISYNLNEINSIISVPPTTSASANDVLTYTGSAIEWMSNMDKITPVNLNWETETFTAMLHYSIYTDTTEFANFDTTNITGYYTKIGNLYKVYYDPITKDSINYSGEFIVTRISLPVTSSNNSIHQLAGYGLGAQYNDYSYHHPDLIADVRSGNNYVLLYGLDTENQGMGYVKIRPIEEDSELRISVDVISDESQSVNYLTSVPPPTSANADDVLTYTGSAIEWRPSSITGASITGASITGISFEEKILTSDIYGNQDILELEFNNLTIGKHYKITGQVALIIDTKQDANYVRFKLINGQTTLAHTGMREDQPNDTRRDIFAPITTGIFVATDTTVVASTHIEGASNFIRGDGDKYLGTFLCLEELSEMSQLINNITPVNLNWETETFTAILHYHTNTGTTDFANFNTTNITGYYTKIGNLYKVYYDPITDDSISHSGPFIVTRISLPVTSSNDSIHQLGGYGLGAQWGNDIFHHPDLIAEVKSGESFVRLYGLDTENEGMGFVKIHHDGLPSLLRISVDVISDESQSVNYLTSVPPPTSANADDVLTYTGSAIEWRPNTQYSDIISALSSLSPNADDILTYTGSAIEWRPNTQYSDIISALSSLSPNADDILTYTGSAIEWRPNTQDSDIISALSSLSPNADDILTYTGSGIEWKTGNYHPLQSTNAWAYGAAPRIVLGSIYGPNGTGGTVYHYTGSQSKVNADTTSYGGMPNYRLTAGNIQLFAHGDQGNFHGEIQLNAYHGKIDLKAADGTIFISAHNGQMYLDGTIRHNGNILSTYSDDRLKHNEYEITNALETMRKLKPIRYQQTLKPFASDHTGDLSGVDHWEAAGFIAQDVKKDIPELEYCVGQNKEHNDYYSLNYMNIMIHAIQAIKELDAKNQALEAKNQALEARIVANLNTANGSVNNNSGGNTVGMLVYKISVGIYDIYFETPRAHANYIVQLTGEKSSSNCVVVHLHSHTNRKFRVYANEIGNFSSPLAFADMIVNYNVYTEGYLISSGSFDGSTVDDAATPPTIILLGDNPLYINYDDTYSDPGIEATDNWTGRSLLILNTGEYYEGNAGWYITSSNIKSEAGTYQVTYEAIDSKGQTNQVTRTVVLLPDM